MDPKDQEQDAELTAPDSEADFDNAFAEFSEPEADADANQPAPEVPEPEASQSEEDPWTTADPRLKAAYDAALTENKQWSHRYNSDVGRLSAYQRQIEQLKSDLAGSKTTVAATEAAQDAAELLDDPDFKELLAEYPEVGKPISKVVSALQAKADALARELAEISGERREQQFAKEEEKLTDVHPDWRQATASPQFLQWYRTAPPGIRADVERHGQNIRDAHEVARLLNVFKAETGWGQTQRPATQGVTNLSAKRARQLTAAAAPAGRGMGAASGAPDDFDAAFAHFARKNSQSR